MAASERSEAYRKAVEQIDDRLRPVIDAHGRAAYEYGVLVQKHLFLLYGGSIILIPPLIKASDTFSVTEAVCSAGWIFLAIILLNICTYIVNLNWNFNLASSQNDRTIEYWQAIERVWGETEDSKGELDALRKKEISLAKNINITFYLPHLFGIASLVSYAIGGMVMIFAISST